MKQKKGILTLSIGLFIVFILVGSFLILLDIPHVGGIISIWGALCLLIGGLQFTFIISFYQGANKLKQEKLDVQQLSLKGRNPKIPSFKVNMVLFCVCLLIGTALAA